MNSVYNTLFEMMQDRGFHTNKSNNINININDFNITFINCNNDKIMIFYINNSKVGINHIKTVIENITNNNCNHCLIIYSLLITSFAKQFIESCDYEIEIFNENELLKNITKHYLVPEHKKLNKNEIKLLTNQLQIKSENLPKLKKNDPISRYFNANVNDVFQITRFDNNIKSLYYRIII